MLAPFREHWDQEVKAGLIGSSRWGRPTIPMATCVRLMVLKHRYRWGYEVLVREVADSLDLRRFCIRYPTDINLVGDAVRTLVRVAGRTIEMVPGVTARVRDRGRAIGKRIRELGRTLQRRTVEARSEVMRLTTESARLLQATLREARQLLVQSLHQVRTMVEQPTRAQVRAVVELAQFAARAEQVAEQVPGASPASPSPTAWSPSSTSAPAPSARASWACPPSSATCSN